MFEEIEMRILDEKNNKEDKLKKEIGYIVNRATKNSKEVIIEIWNNLIDEWKYIEDYYDDGDMSFSISFKNSTNLNPYLRDYEYDGCNSRVVNHYNELNKEDEVVFIEVEVIGGNSYKVVSSDIINFYKKNNYYHNYKLIPIFKNLIINFLMEDGIDGSIDNDRNIIRFTGTKTKFDEMVNRVYSRRKIK